MKHRRKIIKKKSVVFTPTIWRKVTPPKAVAKASQPWSNNRPKEELLPVFLACFPSALSRILLLYDINEQTTPVYYVYVIIYWRFDSEAEESNQYKKGQIIYEEAY